MLLPDSLIEHWGFKPQSAEWVWSYSPNPCIPTFGSATRELAMQFCS